MIRQFFDWEFLFNVLRIKLGLARLPLFISWAVTNRCAYRCLYCLNWQRKGVELELNQITKIINQLAKSGTKWISFTGGEPFLRKDLGQITEAATQKNIIVSVNSSGAGVAENHSILSRIKQLTLSLDGPEKTHNLIKNDQNAYRHVMQAAVYAKQAGVKLKFFAVINKLNLNTVDFLLQQADKFNCPIMFQLATTQKLRSKDSNPIKLSFSERNQVIKCLIDRKAQGARIANSYSGLRFLRQETSQSLKCWGGAAFFRIEPDGFFKVCPRVKSESSHNCTSLDIKTCLEAITQDLSCSLCLSSSRIEFNCIWAPKIEALFNLLKY